MKKTIKQYKFLIIGVFVVYVLVLTSILYEVDYSLVAPGYNDNVEDTIEVVSEYESIGSFHTTSVVSLDRISLYQYLLGSIMKKVDVEDLPGYIDNVDETDLRVMSVLMKDDSISTSIVVGSNEVVEYLLFFEYQMVYLTYNHLTPDTLEVGDIIRSVDGDFDIIYSLTNTECDQTVTVLITRDDVNLEFDITKNEINDTCSFGIYIDTFIYLRDISIDYTINETNTGGPSGGLLQSLYVYNQLTEFDYSLGLKIAGTGTVDVDGNVGYIGGIRQKIITAIDNDIDIFFVPHLNDLETDNYIEALKVLEEFDSDMILVGVTTFSEAIQHLEEGDY